MQLDRDAAFGLARARLELLCDAGSFRPVRSAVGDGVVAGHGRVRGRPVYAWAQDGTLLGGSLGAAGGETIVRTLAAAERARAPVVGFPHSAGARLQEGVAALAAYGAIFRAQALAPEVLHHAKRAVIDLHAAMLSGAVTAPATLLEKALADELDRGAARLALGRKATVRAAALINGAAAHTTEVDDIYRDGIYHPGAPTIPVPTLSSPLSNEPTLRGFS